MAIGSIQITTVTRTQDFTAIKHQEDNKAFVDQSNISVKIEKDLKQRAKEVRDSDNSDWQNKNPDAREKGNNEYRGDGGKNRKRSGGFGETAVNRSRTGFDMKI